MVYFNRGIFLVLISCLSFSVLQAQPDKLLVQEQID